MTKPLLALAGAISAVALCGPAAAQRPADIGGGADVLRRNPLADTAYSGDYLSIGIGAAVSSSYSGSDDYVISPLPIVQASIGGIGISPRSAGLALDFVPDTGSGIGFDLGVAGRLRSSRASKIVDPVVESLGELDQAIEVGPTAGISFSGLLNPYDSVSIGTDVRWDVAGAHGGMVIDPGISYFTPLNEGMAASLSLSTLHVDGEYMDYYYGVTPAQSLATAGELPAFDPDGGGFTSAGAGLLLAFDLNGDIADGGWGIIAVAGYSRMLGDAKRTPFTSVRGSANQFTGAVGLGYTF